MTTPLATEQDYAECSRLHRHYGTSYYFASRRLPAHIRKQVDAVYGFVRVPDEWVDNPVETSPEGIAESLRSYRQALLATMYGVVPSHPVLRAFCDVMQETGMKFDEPLAFLDAMELDLTTFRYSTFADLRNYMRGSAVAVGGMLLYVFNSSDDPETRDRARCLGEAMQLTNFLRDVGEDYRRGRIYLPLDELARFGVTEEQIAEGSVNDAWRELMRFNIARARELFDQSDAGIARLPKEVRFGVALARELYAKILEKIEQNDFDVFRQRAATSPQDKMVIAWRVWSAMS